MKAYQETLAKLLAVENISVIINPVAQTASFDVVNRSLTLPVWKDCGNAVYDMLTGHEVSHALHTPTDWIDILKEKNSMTFKDCLNIIEDVRVDRLIQKRYPGLVRSYVAGYKKMNEMDLFGIGAMSDEEINSLLLHDRINLYYKLGIDSRVTKFSDAERVLLKEIDSMKTWQDAVAIAEKLWDKVMDNMDEQDQEYNDGDSDGQSGDEGQQGEKGEQGESDGEGISLTVDGEGNSEGDSQGEDENEEGQGQSGDDGDDKDGKNNGGNDSRNQRNGSNTSREEKRSQTQKNAEDFMREKMVEDMEDSYNKIGNFDVPVYDVETHYYSGQKIVEDVRAFMNSYFN